MKSYHAQGNNYNASHQEDSCKGTSYDAHLRKGDSNTCLAVLIELDTGRTEHLVSLLIRQGQWRTCVASLH